MNPLLLSLFNPALSAGAYALPPTIRASWTRGLRHMDEANRRNKAAKAKRRAEKARRKAAARARRITVEARRG